MRIGRQRSPYQAKGFNENWCRRSGCEKFMLWLTIDARDEIDRSGGRSCRLRLIGISRTRTDISTAITVCVEIALAGNNDMQINGPCSNSIALGGRYE